MLGYSRKFVKDYSKKTQPLTCLTKKSVESVWGKEDAEAWKLHEDELVRAPILAYPDPENEFILDTDASGCGKGAVFSQILEAFGSRTMTEENCIL